MLVQELRQKAKEIDHKIHRIVGCGFRVYLDGRGDLVGELSGQEGLSSDLSGV